MIVGDDRVIEIANGSPLMTKVTALGCSLSAIVAASAALTSDAFVATASAIAIYGIAGEMAAEKASHPGSFRIAFLDALDAIGETDIKLRPKVR